MTRKYRALRAELWEYYRAEADSRAEVFREVAEREMEAAYREGMTVWEMKRLQYRVITDYFEPVLFGALPFYYEMGTMAAHCDGARDFHGHCHAGGWVYRRREHLFREQNEELWRLREVQGEELFYLICGPYNDVSQHFIYNYRPVLAMGLRGVYEKAKAALERAENGEARAFLESVCDGLLCVKRISEKFAEAASVRAKLEPNREKSENLYRIAVSAARAPWEAPETFYEALNIYAFLRKAVGALEGIGVNSFGRLDMDLYPFYRKDVDAGRLTPEDAYDLICRFLITFDTHYDHDMKMVGYADHELENTYVLGGCDADGRPVYNELTEMFLRATREEKIIFPKIKCRFSKTSPKEYLDAINLDVIRGTSSVLYQNDDATIPALVRAGRPSDEARDYLVSGCWGLVGNGTEKEDGGMYVNLLKAFEYSLHRKTDMMKKVGMEFKPIDGAESFEEVYRITCENIGVLFRERLRITREGGNMWSRVDVLPIFSSTLESCIEKGRDVTAGGGKYWDDRFLCFGLPNIVDSLLAIRTLCFDEKKYTLAELLAAVRANWSGFEEMRRDAIRTPGWGDGSEASTSLAVRFNTDLYAMLDGVTGTYGGRVNMGHLTYTEIRFWGERTLATPDGRRNGEYFSQGLTPSRLKRIPSVTSVINTMAKMDSSCWSANSVVNIILPSNRMTLDTCEAFLRAVAASGVQVLQLNCVNREELLDAQKHPEKYPDLIVRVCGFSARFTSLSPEWQEEFLSRNFYE
ncbi:MAG: hypothetical protein IJX80_00130 [Clostridia bacterium]|nr:hypothetical protein [Clostridia bacterium]